MSYTNGLDKPTDYFNTVLYTGDNTSSRDITGVGFQPDFTWIKQRSDVFSHVLGNSVSGDNKFLSSNGTGAEGTDSSKFRTFVSDGFQVGSHASVNRTSDTYVGWNWLASNTTASNTDGSITSTVSANTTSGFSIVSYTGTGANATVGHGLGSAPTMIIVKNINSTNDWNIGHPAMGWDKRLFFNSNAESSGASWNSTAPTSSVFSIGTASATNTSGNSHIAYCFAEKKGFSKAFSYSGNGSSDGSFTYLGFRPAFVIVKRTDSANAWHLFDNKRNTFNPNDRGLFPDTSDAENTGNQIDFLSNGIKFYSGDGGYNGSGGSYIGLAFAENPFVTSTGIPTTAR